MTLKELEQDVEDYQKVKDEALTALRDSIEWNEQCFERLLAAKKAVETYKKEHVLEIL